MPRSCPGCLKDAPLASGQALVETSLRKLLVYLPISECCWRALSGASTPTSAPPWPPSDGRWPSRDGTIRAICHATSRPCSSPCHSCTDGGICWPDTPSTCRTSTSRSKDRRCSTTEGTTSSDTSDSRSKKKDRSVEKTNPNPVQSFFFQPSQSYCSHLSVDWLTRSTADRVYYDWITEENCFGPEVLPAHC